MASSNQPTDISQFLAGDMTQTPKTLSTSDMAMLLNSDTNTELQTVSSIGQNVSAASLDVLDTVNNVARADSQNIVPRQQVTISKPQVLTPSQISLLNNSKRVILQPANSSMNALVQNLVTTQGGVQMIQGIKRPASSSGSPMVTKLIIQKNAAGEQQPVLIQRKVTTGPGSTSQQQQQQSVIMVTSALTSSTMTSSAAAPQTITLTGSGVLTASDHAQTIQMTNGKAFTPTTPTKIRMIPISSSGVAGKSPQKVIPVTIPKSGVTVTNKPQTVQQLIATAQAGGNKPALAAQLTRPTVAGQLTRPTVAAQLGRNTVAAQLGQVKTVAQMTNMQPVQVAGSKFNYVRLVTNSTSGASSPSVSLVQSIAKPLPGTTTTSTAPQVKIQLPSSSQPGQPILTKVGNQLQVLSGSPGQQQVIVPSQAGVVKPGTEVKPSVRATITNVSQASTVKLPDGVSVTSQATGTPSIETPAGGIPAGFTLVPAQYINTLVSQKSRESHSSTSHPKPLQPKPDPFAPLSVNQSYTTNQNDLDNLSNMPMNLNGTTDWNNSNGLTEAPGTRPRKPCNCTKSQCLKLYCDCFANGEFCNGCNCTNCYNNLSHEEERSKAIRSCLERNPNAFHPKIGKSGYVGADGERRHTKGCNCKKSGCLKNYCECYEAKISCSDMCRCVGCKNLDELEQSQNLLALADVAETRVQHIQARKARLQENKGVNSRLPYTFITSEVGEATCACLLAQAEDSEREHHAPQLQERLILQEYGRCLMQIIESANRTRSLQDSMG